MTTDCRYCTPAPYNGKPEHHPECPRHPLNEDKQHMLIPDDLKDRAHGQYAQ